jgi:IS30 family transposase
MNTYKQLSSHERVVIETLLDERKSISYIAKKLERDKGTISREITRNKTR